MNYQFMAITRLCVRCTSALNTKIHPLQLATLSTGIPFCSQPENTESSVAPKRRKKKEILRLPESELEGYAIGVKKLSLMDRRGEAQSIYRKIIDNDSKSNQVDFLSFVQADIDLRPASVKRWWRSIEAEVEIEEQRFNEKRNTILGTDLSAAHFIVFRKGKVRFKGHTEWISKYRKDALTGEEDEADLPAMAFELCTMPVKYDPRFRLEAIDASNMNLLYEGISNLENLDYVKWLSLRQCPSIDDWCMDKLIRIFCEKLEYLDISGCEKITDRSLGAIRRCSKLKTLVVKDLAHIQDLAIVCAQLEDEMPGLHIEGVDYKMKLLQIKQQNEELERRQLSESAAIEANTITIELPNVEHEDQELLASSKVGK